MFGSLSRSAAPRTLHACVHACFWLQVSGWTVASVDIIPYTYPVLQPMLDGESPSRHPSQLAPCAAGNSISQRQAGARARSQHSACCIARWPGM